MVSFRAKPLLIKSIALACTAILNCISPASASATYQYGSVTNWTIFKTNQGCIAETKTLNDVIALRTVKGGGLVTLYNPQMTIPAGQYLIGFDVGPPHDFHGNMKAFVAKNFEKAITVALQHQDFLAVADSGWVQFDLGEHKHFVNLGEGTAAIRALQMCETSDHDPFANAGGGLIN